MAVSSSDTAQLASWFELNEISKTFGGVHALKDASLRLRAGEIHGLVGQNGAGKSTMIKIMSGAVRPDTGTLTLKGEAVSFGNPEDAQRAGVSTAFQELSLIPDLSVAANLLHGREPMTIVQTVNTRRLVADAAATLESLGLSGLDPRVLVRDISLAERQVVEIAKALSRAPEVLVLDESTSALSPRQVDWLESRVRVHATHGGSVVFVSHRMHEVMGFCDQITVFRNGGNVITGATGSFTEANLIEAMLGKKLDSSFPPKAAGSSDAAISYSVQGVASGRKLRDLSFDARPGDVIGVAALQGQGQKDLFLSLYGCQPHTGEIRLDDDPFSAKSPSRAIAAGVSLIPEDRVTEGIFGTLTVQDNLLIGSLPRVSRVGWIVRSRAERLVRGAIERLNIRVGSKYQDASTLSGGNQQKLLLARALDQTPRVLLMYDATRGVDVATKSDIYALMRQLAEGGVVVIFYSSDVTELVGACDRVLAIHDGTLAAELAGDELTEDNIVRAIVGPLDAQTERTTA